MSMLSRSKTLVMPVVAALIGAGAIPGTATAQPPAESQLKWTPHRAAAAPSTDAATQPSAPPAELGAVPAASTTPAGAPAAIVLPDEVPRTQPAPQRRPAPRTAARSRPAAQGDWSIPNRIPGAMQRALDPGNPNGLFGANMMRTPQGDAIRPILAPEGRQAVAMQQRAAGREAVAAAAAEQRLGGGLAPRYQATPGSRPRIDRIAMNVDGIPSVMRQAPQVGGLDDASVPGRAPTGAGAGTTTEKLPGPPADQTPVDAPSAGDEIQMDIGTFDGGAGMGMGEQPMMNDGSMMQGDGGLLMGDYPAQLHVESFYDDPYACEDDEDLCCIPHGRICAWLRRFGKPYYGWRWYRDFTASAGVTAFTNETDLGINGNFGTNEYLNWAMPFWNAFGVGWQLGWRGTQTNFQPATLEVGQTTLQKNARQQNFITTGFFTRAFEGRGLQGGAVYDYMSDTWFDNVDVSQIRGEISYVWGYHEVGFWGAANIGDQNTIFGPVRKQPGVTSTLDLYCGFYRLQFGDANELKIWGGGTSEQDGIVGTLVRAPLARSFSMEGTFTYMIPGRTSTIDVERGGYTTNFAPAAWNVGVNLVYYPAGRSRRGLASPYRPLFEVADNGSMIRSLQGTTPTP